MISKKLQIKHILPNLAIALAVYSIVSLIFLGKALVSGGYTVVGHNESDVWKHLWGAWWMHEEIFQGRFPIWTDLQNYPSGGRLYIIDPLNAICTALLMPLCGLVTAYNTTQCLQIIMASLSAWGLAFWITKDNRASIIAGLIYGFCPFILSSGIASGIDETSNLAWLPLSILGLMICLNGEQPLWGIALGSLGLALSAIGSWYFGMTAGIFWIITGLWIIFSRRRHPLGISDKVNLLHPILAGLMSILMALPLAVLFAQSLRGQNSLLGQVNITQRQEVSHLEFMYRTGDFKNNAILSNYFLPGKENISVATDVDRRLKTVYIGYMALVLAIVGIWKMRSQAYFWLTTAVVFGLLSLGPYLAITPTISLSKPWSPFYLFAYYVIPGFRMVAICDRLSIGVQISVATLAALGLSRIIPKNIWGSCIATFCGIAIVAELIYISPLPWPIPVSLAKIPKVYQEIARDERRLGVICLPVNRKYYTLQPGEYYYWQTKHKKPLPATLTTRFSEAMMSNSLIASLYLCEDEDYPSAPRPEALVSSLHSARANGFGWIVVNGKLMDAKTKKKLINALTPLLGEPKRFEDDLLYDLHSKKADSWLYNKGYK